ncbi:hypothetical protein [Actinophytocola sp.]|uniref:hypothetical protein n=1 Tax=Actinophytocola sp. TaxID=1872138 RepID=UPI002D80CE50|nr:hypothetical protein [Actinophytocola sp.]HET9141786.1 hypothetical protein [Actinophytocola sp.]
MRTGARLAAFGLALAGVAGGAWAVGAAVGPVEGAEPAAAAEHAAPGQPTAAAQGPLPGLAVAAGGYRLELGQDRLAAAVPEPFRFRILGQDGAVLTRFAVDHDKRLHLVVVRRDGALFQHVHPEMAADGTWSIGLALPAAGSYRVFTDFTPEGGAKTVLGADVQVPGPYEPREHAPSRTHAADGYAVTVAGELVAGRESTVTATVTRDGAPVTDLQPYLGSYGHLVALRAADLGYLHVHPLDGGAGPEVRFAVTVPTPGRYRLFLDFQHGGRVRTAEFTVDTTGTAPPVPPATTPSAEGPHGHGG